MICTMSLSVIVDYNCEKAQPHFQCNSPNIKIQFMIYTMSLSLIVDYNCEKAQYCNET